MKYIGIKFVDAVPMTAEVANEKGYRVKNNTGDGYEVTYEDGYKSWCPKDVFEKHNLKLSTSSSTTQHPSALITCKTQASTSPTACSSPSARPPATNSTT